MKGVSKVVGFCAGTYVWYDASTAAGLYHTSLILFCFPSTASCVRFFLLACRCVFACFVCWALFVCLLGPLFVCLLVGLCVPVRSFVCSCVCLFGCLPVPFFLFCSYLSLALRGIPYTTRKLSLDAKINKNGTAVQISSIKHPSVFIVSNSSESMNLHHYRLQQ